MKKFRVGILGATGIVGQRFLSLLESHPWFEVVCVGSSSRTVGKSYHEAVDWRLTECMPNYCKFLKLEKCDPEVFHGYGCNFVFSALKADAAVKIEKDFVNNSLPVFSNSSAYRYDETVPILIPQVNPEHSSLIKKQASYQKSQGFIVTNANCSSTGIAIALAPLKNLFGGLHEVFVSTMQAVSGAGYPGLSSLDIMGNVIPFISGEEEKIEIEPLKILSEFDEASNSLISPKIKISAMCHRVPVIDGHLISISVKFKDSYNFNKKDIVEKVQKTLENAKANDKVLGIPSMPEYPIRFLTFKDRPQPRLDCSSVTGMYTTIGRLRPCQLLDIKFTLTTHNTIMGAAGGSILNAELIAHDQYI